MGENIGVSGNALGSLTDLASMHFVAIVDVFANCMHVGGRESGSVGEVVRLF